jgi:hypothetical protein
VSPLSRRELANPRALEAYIRSAVLPRFMERLREIEDALAEHRMRLEREYRALQRSCAGDPATFERRWRAVAEAWSFGDLNELIRQHNEYYPMERDLPMDPRTGEYVTINGRSYRRQPVGPDWILERFPAAPRAGLRD